MGIGLSYILKSILALIIIIFAANHLLHYLNGYMKKKNKAITVIERLAVSKHSSICIVEICGTVYLMSVTDKQTEIIKEFSESERKEIISISAEKEKEQFLMNKKLSKTSLLSSIDKLQFFSEKRK